MEHSGLRGDLRSAEVAIGEGGFEEALAVLPAVAESSSGHVGGGGSTWSIDGSPGVLLTVERGEAVCARRRGTAAGGGWPLHCRLLHVWRALDH